MEDINAIAEVTRRHDISPAQLDAMSWGRLIGGPAFEDELEFLCQIVGNPDEELHQIFVQRLEYNQQSLEDDTVSLLLSDDDMPIEERLSQLADWSRMFISSLGFGKNLQDKEAASRVASVLEDCRAIGNIEAGGQTGYNNTEEVEIGYMEVVEFLRINIIFLHSELAEDIRR